MQNKKIKNKEEIEKAIRNVIVFFDMFDYPLTDHEIWQYLEYECDFIDVKNILKNGLGENMVYKSGFYFLEGRDEIISTRMRRYNYANRKIEKAMKITKLFRFVPWIKMLAIGNSIGDANMRNGSDIDIFIITEKKRAWITRFFCVIIAKFLNVRPTPEVQKDRICLSYYISDLRLNVREMMLDDHEMPDLYFIYWLACLTPIYNKDNYYNKFIEENNWVNEYLPNWFRNQIHKKYLVKNIDSVFYRDVIDMFIGGIEDDLKRWQYKIMPEYLARTANASDGVVVNDHVIKLHYNDRRRKIMEKYKYKINNS